MEAGDILRLFYTDGTTSSFLVVRFDLEAVFLKSPAGDHVLHHTDGRLDTVFEGKTLAAFAHIHPDPKTFKIGQKVALTFGDEQVVGEIKESDDGLVGVLVNHTLIYVDLVNPPKEFTIRETEEALPEAPYVAVESALEAELFPNQLLHLYSKLLAEIPEQKQTFAVKRRINGIVRKFKQLHDEFSTPNLLPKAIPVQLQVSPWICPVVHLAKFLYDDVRVTDHTESMTQWVDSYQTALSNYTSSATGARVAVLDREIADLFRPFVAEGAAVPFQEGYAFEVPVLHKTLRPKRVFVQHFAAEKAKVEGYVFLPEWVPFSRVALSQTPLLEKCAYHPGYLKYRYAVKRLDRHRVHRLLQREAPMTTTALNLATALERLAPYGYNKDVANFKEAAVLSKQVERNVAAYKKLLKRGTLERSVRAPENKMPPPDDRQERLILRVKAAAGQLDELPVQAGDLLDQLAELMRGGLNVENAAGVAAFIDAHGRETTEPWIYFRDPAIKTLKFVPTLVSTLANAYCDGSFPEKLAALSAVARVEDGLVVDPHSGYVLTRSLLPPKGDVVPAEEATPLYSLTDLPVAAAFRTLCDHAAVHLSAYEEYVVHRLRGVRDWVPTLAAYVAKLISKEGVRYANWKSATPAEAVAKIVAGFKNGVWPTTTESAFLQKMERTSVAQDYKLQAPPLLKALDLEWPSFLPLKEGPVGSCDAVHENVDSSVKGRIFACSVQVALLARKSPASAEITHRIALIGDLSKRVRFPEAQLALCTTTRDMEYAPGKTWVDAPVEEAPNVELAAALNHFEVQDVSKMGNKLAANTAVIRAQLRSRKKGVDFVDDLIQETGEWVGASSLHRVLLNFTQWVAVKHDDRYLKSGKFTETDRVVPVYTPEYAGLLTDLNEYYTIGELPPLDPRLVLVAKHACATRNLTLAKFCVTSVLALRGPALGGFVRTLKNTLKRLNKVV
jgi:hypothetical protein